MKTRIIPLAFPLLLLLPLLIQAISTVALIDPTAFASEAPSPAVTSTTTISANNDTEFIRASCETTRYPELCFHSLSGYANAVQNDSGRLARIAIGVSLSRARNAAIYFNNLSKEADYGAEPRLASALHDCFSVFGDAVDQIKDSLQQMRRLRMGGSRESFMFQMSNVQTWMSAALTNEDTCTDGFEDVPDCPTKTDVSDHVHSVEEMTRVKRKKKER
ncbi:hypothetical protein M9H77_08763 [Catharanthus roseus]|uniref:Uncharacterized protein n=1 Tax=Catharanthus roseus TaxID=4058 RepID=A0ACC0BYN1_CATRO|nr:hypothetical protein M9H77_08763 [Catharanthus roseus]